MHFSYQLVIWCGGLYTGCPQKKCQFLVEFHQTFKFLFRTFGSFTILFLKPSLVSSGSLASALFHIQTRRIPFFSILSCSGCVAARSKNVPLITPLDDLYDFYPTQRWWIQNDFFNLLRFCHFHSRRTSNCVTAFFLLSRPRLITCNCCFQCRDFTRTPNILNSSITNRHE